MGLIAPGRMVKCIEAAVCDCGEHKVSEGALYRCEVVFPAPLGHVLFFCPRPGKCDGMMLWVTGRAHGFCACCFKPMDDGDTSLVLDEEIEVDPSAPTAPAPRNKEIA